VQETTEADDGRSEEVRGIQLEQPKCARDDRRSDSVRGS